MIEIAALKDWLGLISLLISVGTSIVLFVGSGSKKNAERLDKQEIRLGEHDRLIQKIVGELEHLPNRDSLHRLEMNMEKLNARLDVFAESLKPIRNNTELLNDLLREQVKK